MTAGVALGMWGGVPATRTAIDSQAPEHPVRKTSSTTGAGLLARGSVPVPPGLPGAERQWTMDGELAAYSCGGSFGFGAGRLTEFPLSSGSNPENLDRGQPIQPGRAVKGCEPQPALSRKRPTSMLLARKPASQ